MGGVLNDVVLAPLLAEQMTNDSRGHRERQAVGVGPDLLGNEGAVSIRSGTESRGGVMLAG